MAVPQREERAGAEVRGWRRVLVVVLVVAVVLELPELLRDVQEGEESQVRVAVPL